MPPGVGLVVTLRGSGCRCLGRVFMVPGGGGSCRRGSTVYCYDKYVSIMFDLSSFINVCTYIV